MLTPAKILVIEDDRDIAELISFNLKNEGYRIENAYDGLTALAKAPKVEPQLIILDLMLPKMSGLEVCRKLRASQQTMHIPIIMLTAKSEEVDRVVGFEMGADDYLAKPFSIRELILRVKAILKRTLQKTVQPQIIRQKELSVNPDKFQVFLGKAEITLTSIEFKLLHYLIANPGRVATREKLLDKVWGYESSLTTRTVDTHIKRLRKKLKHAGNWIQTVHGVGYRFKEEV